MRDIKRYEAFFRPEYSYETLKENEKQIKKNKEGDENLPSKAKIMSFTWRTTKQ